MPKINIRFTTNSEDTFYFSNKNPKPQTLKDLGFVEPSARVKEDLSYVVNLNAEDKAFILSVLADDDPLKPVEILLRFQRFLKDPARQAAYKFLKSYKSSEERVKFLTIEKSSLASIVNDLNKELTSLTISAEEKNSTESIPSLNRLLAFLNPEDVFFVSQEGTSINLFQTLSLSPLETDETNPNVKFFLEADPILKKRLQAIYASPNGVNELLSKNSKDIWDFLDSNESARDFFCALPELKKKLLLNLTKVKAPDLAETLIKFWKGNHQSEKVNLASAAMTPNRMRVFKRSREKDSGNAAPHSSSLSLSLPSSLPSSSSSSSSSSSFHTKTRNQDALEIKEEARDQAAKDWAFNDKKTLADFPIAYRETYNAAFAEFNEENIQQKTNRIIEHWSKTALLEKIDQATLSFRLDYIKNKLNINLQFFSDALQKKHKNSEVKKLLEKFQFLTPRVDNELAQEFAQALRNPPKLEVIDLEQDSESKEESENSTSEVSPSSPKKHKSTSTLKRGQPSNTGTLGARKDFALGLPKKQKDSEFSSHITHFSEFKRNYYAEFEFLEEASAEEKADAIVPIWMLSEDYMRKITKENFPKLLSDFKRNPKYEIPFETFINAIMNKNKLKCFSALVSRLEHLSKELEDNELVGEFSKLLTKKMRVEEPNASKKTMVGEALSAAEDKMVDDDEEDNKSMSPPPPKSSASHLGVLRGSSLFFGNRKASSTSSSSSSSLQNSGVSAKAEPSVSQQRDDDAAIAEARGDDLKLT